jgi:hypothetical protein
LKSPHLCSTSPVPAALRHFLYPKRYCRRSKQQAAMDPAYMRFNRYVRGSSSDAMALLQVLETMTHDDNWHFRDVFDILFILSTVANGYCRNGTLLLNMFRTPNTALAFMQTVGRNDILQRFLISFDDTRLVQFLQVLGQNPRTNLDRLRHRPRHPATDEYSYTKCLDDVAVRTRRWL